MRNWHARMEQSLLFDLFKALIRSWAVINRIFFSEKTDFPLGVRNMSLPSNIITMIYSKEWKVIWTLFPVYSSELIPPHSQLELGDFNIYLQYLNIRGLRYVSSIFGYLGTLYISSMFCVEATSRWLLGEYF